nr:hypothetical protein L203_03356 [Cryptococcus depauperatus CBS 7841]
MGGRQVKPLKAPKKFNKELYAYSVLRCYCADCHHSDDDDLALKEKLKKEKADLKKAADMGE